MALEEYQESRYYFLPEPLFYYTWRFLCMASGSEDLSTIDDERLPKELHTLRDHLIRRVAARIGAGGDNALCPAVRLLICQSLGIDNPIDVQILLDLQQHDGSFGQAWYVRYGSAGIRISHRAFACVAATVGLRRLRHHAMGIEGATVNVDSSKTVDSEAAAMKRDSKMVDYAAALMDGGNSKGPDHEAALVNGNSSVMAD